MVDPLFVAFVAGTASAIAYAIRRRTTQNRQSLLAFARRRKGKVRSADALCVVVDVDGLPVTVDFSPFGLRAHAPYALGAGPDGVAAPGPFDSEYLASIGPRTDRPQRLANRLLRSYRWTGDHRVLKTFAASCASELSTRALTVPLVTTSRRTVTVEHRVLNEHADLEDLAEGLVEFTAAIARWQMARVEEASKQLRAPVVLRARGDHVEPECTSERVRFVFRLSDSPAPQALVVHASIRCEPRASLDAIIDRHGVRPGAEEIIPPRAAELIPELGSCTLQLRPKQDASLRWPDVTSAAELEAGARFLQLIATNKLGAGAFR